MKRLLLLFCFFVCFPVFAATVACPVSGKTGCINTILSYWTGGSARQNLSSNISETCNKIGRSEYVWIFPDSAPQSNGYCQKPGGLSREYFWHGLTCPSSYYIYNNICVPRCSDAEYWDGTVCRVIPDCPANATFNPQTEECDTKCPSNATKDFAVPIGFFPADYNSVIDAILGRVRSAMGANHCVDGCLFAANKNLSIHPSGKKDSAGNVLYYALFSGKALSSVCSSDNWDGDDFHHGGDDPPEDDKKCKVPGTRWSELAKACLCKDGMEPAGDTCTEPYEDEEEGGGDSGEGGSGEGGSGEGGSGE